MTRRRPADGPALILAVALSLAAGCRSRNDAARFLQVHGTPPVIGTITLDATASPQQVVWACMQVALDRIAAVAANDRAADEQGLEQHCRMADLTGLRAAIPAHYDAADADMTILQTIQRWSATLNYYAAYLDRDVDAAAARMTTAGNPASGEMAVAYVLPSAQHGGPTGLEHGVQVLFQLARDAGGATDAGGAWRVRAVLFGKSPDLSPHQPRSGA